MGGAGKGQKGSGSLQADTWQALPGSEGRGCEVSFGVQKKQKPRLSTCFLVCPNSGLPTGEEKDLQDSHSDHTGTEEAPSMCWWG